MEKCLFVYSLLSFEIPGARVSHFSLNAYLIFNDEFASFEGRVCHLSDVRRMQQRLRRFVSYKNICFSLISFRASSFSKFTRRSSSSPKNSFSHQCSSFWVLLSASTAFSGYFSTFYLVYLLAVCGSYGTEKENYCESRF